MTHFRTALLAALFLCAGCTPALHPIAYRLNPQDQARLDRGWSTILATPAEPDRQLVLDSIVATQMHHIGIDKFWFRAEKKFDKGTVVMTSYFDRTAPCDDRFDVDILDHDRVLLRRLSYTGIEVHQANADINNFVLPVEKSKDSPDPATLTPAEVQADSERQRKIEERKSRVKAVFEAPAAPSR